MILIGEIKYLQNNVITELDNFIRINFQFRLLLHASLKTNRLIFF